MVAFAHALGFSLDTALGTDLKQKAIFWDALASPRYSFELIKLIQQHQKESKDVWGYAGFLPCSLETPEFMAAHHRQIFARLPGTSEAEWQSMVRVYNQIGDIRRSQLVQKDRKWRFNNFMLLPDLEKIVRRTAEYKNVDKKLVKGCMENLIALIGTPSLRMNFVFSTEEDVQELLPFLRDCDTRLMFGESLALWRDHRGNITWSEHPRIIYQQKELFTKLFHKATFKRLPEVIAKLKALLKLI